MSANDSGVVEEEQDENDTVLYAGAGKPMDV